MVFISDPFQRLTVRGTIRRTFQILIYRYDLFLFFTSLTAVPFYLAEFALLNFNNTMTVQQQPLSYMTIFLALGTAITFVIIYFVGSASMCHAVAELYAGRNSTWLASLRQGFSIGFWFPCSLVLMLAVPGLSWLLTIGYGSGLFIILLPVIMVEGKGPIDSIKRCLELSLPHLCYIFCTYFRFAMIYGMVYLALFLILMAAAGGIEEEQLLGWGALVITLPDMVFIPVVSMYVQNK
jgi:hypothetical protein